MKAPRETDIQRAILDYLRLRGAVATRVNSGAVKTGKRFVRFNSEPGCSDILACFRGRFLALEVKRPGNDTTDKQASFLSAVAAAGGVTAVVRSVADVERILETLEG